VPFLDMASLPLNGSDVSVVASREVGSGGSKFQVGDTLFARITPCAENGKLGFVRSIRNGDVAQGSTEFIVMAGRDGLTLPEYVSYLAGWTEVRGRAIGLMEGTSGRQRVPNWAFDEIEVPIPPLHEQRRIAEVLRSVDDAVAKSSAVLSKFVEVRAHQLEGLMALPGEMRPLADVCRLGGGYGFPIKHQGKRNGAYPFAKVSDMNRSGNETELGSAENYVDESDLKVLRAKPFPPGTTLFPKVGATLLTNKRRIASREIIVDNNVMGAVPTDIDPWFLFYAFNTIDMADYVQPGAVPSVNQGTIGKIMIPVPSREVQRQYVGTMRDLDQAIETQRATISSLSLTKAAVTSDLLSGRVRVPA
jgi:type I restriction enzyme S subunit